MGMIPGDSLYRIWLSLAGEQCSVCEHLLVVCVMCGIVNFPMREARTYVFRSINISSTLSSIPLHEPNCLALHGSQRQTAIRQLWLAGHSVWC